uniref:GPI inositol-deacylase n=1 Tax=Cacopsylla melanoneura TaxID=428564 RepID=A0A8D8RFK7_9HEMI
MVQPTAKIFILPYAIAVCFVYLLGVVNFLTNLEENRCDMTFMYEFPQYTEIPISPDVDRKYRQYSLSAYSEGILTERVKQMDFFGIPVLFIPGHSGSGKQVRSLASVAFRKAVDESHLHQHFFDFFSVDFNGEYSALFGGVLEAQTQYVKHALNKILALYPPEQRPPSVVIFGYSMGGMIAKGLYLQPDFNPNRISTIITLATPHQPVLLLDTYLNDYYTKVNKFWSSYAHESTSIVSIGGGNADIHVRSSLTKTNHVDICTTSSMIPAVWVGVDHQSFVWCKRLIKVLVRILFDSVDPQTRQISNSVHHRNNVLKYHLSERYGGKNYWVAQNLGSQIFSSEGSWLEFVALQDTLEYRGGVRVPTHILIKILPLASNPQHEVVAIDTLNIPGDNHWLYACSANEFDGKKKYCQVGENLSGQARYLPSIKGKHLRTYLSLDELRANKHTHVLIKIPPYDEYFKISYDIHRPRDRLSSLSIFSTLPFSSSLFSLPRPSFSLSHDRPTLVHSLVVKDMNYVWWSVRVKVTPLCDPSHPYHQSVATVRVPWCNQNSRHVIWRNTSSQTFSISLYDPKPMGVSEREDGSVLGEEQGQNDVSVTFELDSSCRYFVSVQFSLWDSLSAFIFSYTPMLLPHSAAILLFLLSYQLAELGCSGSCSMFHIALVHTGGNPLGILLGVKAVSSLVYAVQYVGPNLVPSLSSFFSSLTPDTATLYAQQLDSLIIPVLLYSCAMSCVVITGIVGLLSIVVWGKTMNSWALGFLAKLLKGSALYSEWTMKILEKIPGLVAALMLSIAYNTCGGLAFAVGFCMFFLKLVLLYEDIFEKILFLPLNVLKRYLVNKLKRYRQSKRANQNQSIETNTLANQSIQNSPTSNANRAPENTRTRNSPTSNTLDNRALETTRSTASRQTNRIANRESTITDGNQTKMNDTDITIDQPETSRHPESNSKRNGGGKTHSGQFKTNNAGLRHRQTKSSIRNNDNERTANEIDNEEHGDVTNSNTQTDQGGVDIKQTRENIRNEAARKGSKTHERPLVIREENQRPLAVKRETVGEDEDDEEGRVTFRDLNFHFTLFLLWVICTLLSFPSTLVWAKNFGDTMQLSPDPLSTSAVIMSICAAILWQADLPKPNSDYYDIVSTLTYLAGCYVLLFAQTSLYRLIPSICFVFVVICAHQLLTSLFRLNKPRPASTDADVDSSSTGENIENSGDQDTPRRSPPSSSSLFTTNVEAHEELVRDFLDSHLNCLYKKVVARFRNIGFEGRPAENDEDGGENVLRQDGNEDRELGREETEGSEELGLETEGSEEEKVDNDGLRQDEDDKEERETRNNEVVDEEIDNELEEREEEEEEEGKKKGRKRKKKKKKLSW